MLPSSTKIQINQNTEALLSYQFAAREYYNRAEICVYLSWFLTIIFAALPLLINNDVISIIICTLFDFILWVLSYYLNSITKLSADMRKVFDYSVLFEKDAPDTNHSTDTIKEKTFTLVEAKPIQHHISIMNNSHDIPPGVKDWYEFNRDFLPAEAQFDCQRQNIWWTDKMSIERSVALTVSSIALLTITILTAIFFPARVASKINMFIIVIIFTVKRIKDNISFMVQALKARIYHEALEALNENQNETSLIICQQQIDSYRQIPVFGMNFFHRKMAGKFSKLYSRIQ